MHSLIHSPSTKDVLGGKAEKVVVSSRMADSICILTTSEYVWSAKMQGIMKAQTQRDSSMTSYFDEPTQFARRIHCMTQLGLSIHDVAEGLKDDGNLSPIKEVDGAADEASKMEDVDRFNAVLLATGGGLGKCSCSQLSTCPPMQKELNCFVPPPRVASNNLLDSRVVYVTAQPPMYRNR